MSDDSSISLLERLPSISQNERNRDQLRVTYIGDNEVYLLPKAPALAVHGVTDDFGTEYERGVDYQILTNSDGQPQEIDWGIGGDSPSVDTDFIVDETFQTIISRFAEAHDEEFDFYDHEIEDAIEGRHVDSATGDELDKIGRIFGPLGRRAGRDDQDYKLYLKSIVKSFNGRGTVPGLQFAVASSLGADVDSVQIVEDFENLEYNIRINEWPPHTGSNIETLADLADPSVVTLGLIRYQFEEEMGVGDTIVVSVSEIIDEIVTADDALAVDPNLLSFAEAIVSDDSVFVDDDLTTITEASQFDDATANRSRDLNTTRWENQDKTHEVRWDFAEWTEYVDLGVIFAEAEEIAADDAVTIPPKDVVLTDESASDDALTIDPRTFDVADEAASDDAVTDTRFRDVNSARWEEQTDSHEVGWDFFEWTELIELQRAIADASAADDTTLLNDNLTTVNDESAADDTTLVNNNLFTEDEQIASSDVTTTNDNLTTISDTGGSADDATITPTAVAWESGQWNTMTWTKAHN